eukprot:GEZU01022435.1.p1 GENE.GEZU01022435.1~~GEZU01022435.1.p1  ORF type:complete len:151 (+),score=18.79 GEZU01022435.1:274-726(+)
MNPVDFGGLTITSSSPKNFKFTVPHYLADRTFHSTSFAVGNPPYFCFDLGQQHSLICTRYTMRHDGRNDDFIRNWRLEGTNEVDAAHWTVMDERINDTTISYPRQFASFAVKSSAPFRFFRIVMTGPTSSGNRQTLVCSSFELYGLFIHM